MMNGRSKGFALGLAVVLALGSRYLPANATVGTGDRNVFVPIVPCRLFDTRPANLVGSRYTPIGPGDTMVQSVSGTNGNCTIPSDATAVAMNVTSVNGTAASYLTVWPSDSVKPLASSLNWIPGSPPTPNKVDVKLSAAGKISLFNNAGAVDVVADVVGYYVDHNHDDRYYTKAEIDQRREVIVGRVSAGGAKLTQGNWTVEHTFAGTYRITFERPASLWSLSEPIVPVVTPFSFFARIAGYSTISVVESSPGVVRFTFAVVTRDPAASATDTEFAFMVSQAG